MNNQIAHKIRTKGFSLVEMAIVIFIAGILLTAGLKLLSVRVNSAQIETTTTHQDAIKQALIAYLGKNKRLPCPGNIADGFALPPPCNSTSGIVPYSELGLDQAAVLDGWENYFTYVITPNPITLPLLAKSPPYTTSWTYAYNPTNNTPPSTNNPSLAFWPTNSTGGIIVSDGINEIAKPTLATGAVIALISHGRNGYGALNVKQALNDASDAYPDEKQNINLLDATGNLKVVKKDTTESTDAGGVFDDIVITLNSSELITPLITNGTFGENSSVSLYRANDYILGAIISTKFCVGTPSDCSYNIPDKSLIPLSIFENIVDYERLILPPTVNISTPPGPAYRITAGDGTVYQMTVDQLRGLLARGSGF
ncbi:MAG: hypothetical protein BVN34_08275 [Proteobacteria bacterium ST_bin12]|nr:MAG: hypothetical protein BVN34_08275 [Proteobacteria bacterium ST_bin12]